MTETTFLPAVGPGALPPLPTLADDAGAEAQPDSYRPPPARSALRIYGGKRRKADWIISQFPAHTCYVEPFGGAMSVLLRKQPSVCEVYNDADSELVNFFRVLREQPDALIRAIALTPYSREEVDRSCAPTGTETPLEAARLTYVRSWQSRHGLPAVGKMGWRYDIANARQNVETWRTGPESLWQIVDRMKEVQLEHGDALKLFSRYDRKDTLFYVDPPYVAETRGKRWATTAYKHELTDDDHVVLAARLNTLKGMVVVSGYDSELYDRLYAGWHKVKAMAQTHNSKIQAVETLWLSPNITLRQPYLIPPSLPMDDADDEDDLLEELHAWERDHRSLPV